MTGRMLGLVQDFYGGFYDEARARCPGILRDIQKRDYSARLTWKVYDTCGRSYTTSGDGKQALPVLERALEVGRTLGSDEAVESLRVLAFAYATMNQVDRSILLCEEAAKLKPGDYDNLTDLGSYYQVAKRSAESRATLEKAIASDQTKARAFGALGNLHKERGEWDEALAAYENAATRARNPSWMVEYLINAADICQGKQDHDHAAGLLRRALDTAPDNALVWAKIGASLLALGRNKEAVDAFERALKLHPSKEAKELSKKGLRQARGGN